MIVEPICTFKVSNGRITSGTLIDSWLNPDFDTSQIRTVLEDGVQNADGSDLDQVLGLLEDNVFVVADGNPVTSYPGERLNALLTKVLPSSPPVADNIRGICHFHPTPSAQPSDLDQLTLKQVAGVLETYRPGGVVSLILAMGTPSEYVRLALGPKDAFVRWMMAHRDQLRLDCRLYLPTHDERILDITIR